MSDRLLEAVLSNLKACLSELDFASSDRLRVCHIIGTEDVLRKAEVLRLPAGAPTIDLWGAIQLASAPKQMR